MSSLLFKKYKDRKLYSYETGKYVNGEDIMELLLNRKNFTVLDSTNNDITVAVVLATLNKKLESLDNNSLILSLNNLTSLIGGNNG